MTTSLLPAGEPTLQALALPGGRRVTLSRSLIDHACGSSYATTSRLYGC